MIIIQVMTVFLAIFPKYKLIIAIFILYSIGIVLNFIFNVIFNLIIVLNPCPPGTLFDFICPESEFIGLNVSILVLGVANIMFSLIVIFVIQFKLKSIMRLFGST